MLGAQKKVEVATAQNFSSVPTRITETYQTSYESSQKFQESSQSVMEVNNAYKFSRGLFNSGRNRATFSRQTLGSQHTTDLFEDITLPEDFLHDYYSQKAQCTLPSKDSLLEYDFEGQGSPAGSVGCCSLVESDDDLQFLNDLGSKFKTLAEVCVPPKATPQPSLISSTATAAGINKTTLDTVEPVVQPKTERIVEVNQTEKHVSSTNISKSFEISGSSASSSVTPSRSTVTNFTHSSNLSRSASMSRQAPTVVLQQQPIYYTTSPMLQPMHYVVQPQFQNRVLMADGTRGATFPGMYVVNGSQSPSGLVIGGSQGSPSQLGIQGIVGPKTSASPTSPVNPTLLLPVSPGMSPSSLSMDGWKIMGPNADGNYVLVNDKSSPGEAGVNPGTSQGSSPRGATLDKEAAPPQGVLGPAAQGRVYGILPGHLVGNMGCAFSKNKGQTLAGKPGQMTLRPNFLGAVQPNLGMGHMPASLSPGVREAGINSAGMGQDSVNQFQGILPLDETVTTGSISQTCSTNSVKEDSVLNNVTTAKKIKTHKPSKKKGTLKNVQEDNTHPSQKLHNYVEEKKSEDEIAYTSEQDIQDGEHPSEGVQNKIENNGIHYSPLQATEKSAVSNFEDDIVKSLQGTDELQTSFEQSETSMRKTENPAELKNISEAPTDNTGFRDLISQTTNKTYEKISPFHEGEKVVSIPGNISIENKKVGTSVQLSIGEESSDVQYKPQSIDTSEDQNEKRLEEDLSPGRPGNPGQELMAGLQADSNEGDMIKGHTKSCNDNAETLKTALNTVATCLTGQDDSKPDNPTYISVPQDTSTQEQAESSAIQKHKQHFDLAEDCSSDHTEYYKRQKGASGSERVVEIVSTDEEKEEIILEGGVSQSLRTFEGQDEDIEPPDALSQDGMLISDDISTSEKKDEIAVERVTSPVEHNTSYLGDNSKVDASDIGKQTDNTLISHDNSFVQEKATLSRKKNVSQIDDLDEEIGIEYAEYVPKMDTMEDVLILEDNISEAAIVEDSVKYEESSGEPTSNMSNKDSEKVDETGRSSPVEDQIIAEEKMNSNEYEEPGKEDATGTSYPVEEQLITDGNVDVAEKENHVLEDMILPMKPHPNISNDAGGVIIQIGGQLISESNMKGIAMEKSTGQEVSNMSNEDSEQEDESGRSSAEEGQLVAEDNIEDEAVEDSSGQLTTSMSDEDSEKEDASGRSSAEEDQLVAEDNVEEEAVEISTGQLTPSISDENEDPAKEDASRRSSPEIEQLITEHSVSGVAMEELPGQKISGISNEFEDSNEEDISGTSSPMDDQMIVEDNMGDEAVEESPGRLATHMSDDVKDSNKEDLSGTGHPMKEQLITEASIKNTAVEDDFMEDEYPGPQMTHISYVNENSEKDDPSHTMFQVQKEEKMQPIEQTSFLYEQQDDKEDDGLGTLSRSQDQFGCSDNASHEENEQGNLTSPLMQNMPPSVPGDQTLERPAEDILETSEYFTEECSSLVNQGQGKDSLETRDTSQDFSERQDINMESLDDVVASAEELKSHRVATGQVSMSSENKGGIASTLASGHLTENETIHSDSQELGGIQTEQEEFEVLTLKRDKTEDILDPEVKDRSDTSGQVLTYSVATSSEFGNNTGSEESGAASARIPGASYPIENQMMALHDLQVPERGGGEPNQAQSQEVNRQTPQRKTRKSRKDSGKCKQS